MEDIPDGLRFMLDGQCPVDFQLGNLEETASFIELIGHRVTPPLWPSSKDDKLRSSGSISEGNGSPPPNPALENTINTV